MQDPDDFLKAQDLTFKDPVDPLRPVVIDALHRVRIGNDWFYFASQETKEKFQRDPFHYVSALSDPVDHTRFAPSKSSPKARRAGVEYRFASKATQAAFQAAPDSFYHARGQMLP